MIAGVDPVEGNRAPSGVNPVLVASGISKSFGGIAALANVGLEIYSGEIHALVGENGAGKSTLMKVLSGVHESYEGNLLLDGKPVRFSSVRDAEAQGITIIHQELNLVRQLNVADNIFLGREPRIAGLIIDRASMRTETSGLLRRLGIDLDPDARVSTLRVGEQQLVEIAKALSLSARILIMDEPTSALSQSECEQLFRIVRQLANNGVAVIYISHRLDEVTELADRITVLRDGRHILTKPIDEIDQNAIIAAMVGRNLLSATSIEAQPSGRCLLSVRNLTLSRPHRSGLRDVVRGVSFEVHAGEILGIGGLLGSGRTEILETIFGSAAGQRSCEIKVDGRAVAIESPRDARRAGIAFVPEDRKTQGLHLFSSISDNVALPVLGRLAKNGLRSFEREARTANEAVRSLDIRCNGVRQTAGTLSGGNQQKVVIGKWLATKPLVLLLDEPTRGIDVGAKHEIYALIFRLAREEGLGIIVVSSEMPELLLLSDRILVMSEGRQMGILVRSEASEERIMQLAAPRSSKTH
jgi:ribose transport system ATP-binding protein